MTDNWDFYFCSIDNETASIFVDLGFASNTPKNLYQKMAYLRLEMRFPREDGLSSSQEYEALKKFEDEIVPVLTSGDHAVYVGRNTSGGYRDYYFYTNDDANWNNSVESVMTKHAEYTYESGCRDDPDWEVYEDFLLPSAKDWQQIQNRRVCDSLESHGNKNDISRDVDHWICFRSDKDRIEFIGKAQEIGFSVRNTTERTNDELSYVAQIFRVDSTEFNHINDVVLSLFDLAVECAGDYDGWETEIIT